MNSTLITMEPQAAKEKLQAYRRNKHKDAEEEYSACEQAYRALALGTPLIDVDQAIREGDYDAFMRPNIAIAPADRKQVRFRWNHNRHVAEFDSHSANATRRSDRLVRFVDMQQQHGQVRKWYSQHDQRHYTSSVDIDAYARVPMVPADVRPATGQLKEWYILWEVEHWSEKPFLAEPPRDPYLLKHIGGTLYAVLAEWDLTELERSIMRNQQLS